jgi:heat shock protein HtpX
MPANLYEQQASNRRRTWGVMALFVAFLFLLGYGVDRFYWGISFPATGLVALVFGSVSAVSGYFHGDRAVLKSCGAVALEDVDVEHASPEARLKLKQLQNVVEEVSLAAGVPSPKVYIIPDQDPNAFATGRDPARASIAVTRGLLETLNREELQGVVAHEMSHVRNYDIRVMTVVAALVGAVALLSDWATRGMSWGGGKRGGRDKEGGGGGGLGWILFVVWVVAIILAPLVAQILAMMVSRNREYLADASGAELTRNPLGLASALEKIEAAVEPTRAIKRGTANLCIADPLGRPAGRKEGRWADLIASHPPMEKRIATLRRIAYV